MLSIFDIYFKNRVVHGMEPVPQPISPPAKRLVLFVAGGMRTDKFFEQESEGQLRAPFLRSVTQSSPGHISITAGVYEDPSAVTKVRNAGSWMEIGDSINHFENMSAQVVFVLMLFALPNRYARDIENPSL
ncbi:GPI ethanolamine phosphate transferase 1 [Phoenix dactylifera]|uniref:GPI ethanolamine phosphate transferase 1 n=1 Tax=Phoenix dactylifera TaxID=42345 RepID=A0A8B9AC26_PHODC|nr:GPI ethanolamine phosphate transferase 1 [Phoenix dactylifera]